MRLLVLLVACFVVTKAFAQTTFDIRRHTTATLSDLDADRILGGAQQLLQNIDGPGDVRCKVVFKRSGRVAVFSVGNGLINSARQLHRVFAEPGQVKIVREVNFCGGKYDTETIGCALQPGKKIILERLTESPGLEPNLFAHEYGHNVNNPHRDRFDERYVMNISVSTISLRVNDDERKRYENGRSNAVGPANRRTRQIQAPATKQEVVEFVQRRFVSGVPWDVAAEIPPSHCGMLVEMLNNREHEKSWGNVAAVLGLIGSKKEAQALKNFAVKEGKSISSAEYRARRNAVAYMGAIVNRTEDEGAQAFLVNIAEGKPGSLQAMKWTTNSKSENAQQERDEQIRIAALWGLAYAGTDASAQALKRIGSGRKGTIGEIAQSAAQALNRIKQVGLVKYGAEIR